MSTVADRIRESRETMHLTQEELAERMGFSGKSSVCKIESSGDKVSLKTIKKASSALGVSIPYLMGWAEDDKPSPSDGITLTLMELMKDPETMKALDVYVTLSEGQKKHIRESIHLFGKE